MTIIFNLLKLQIVIVMESNLRSGIHVIKDFACKVCNIESLTHVNLIQ